MDGVFWIPPTEVPWRDLPPDYGDWKNTHRRFCRWRDKGIWEKLLENLSPEPELKWLMMDFSHMKVHPHGVGAKGGNWEMGRTMGATPNCIFSWVHLVSQAYGRNRSRLFSGNCLVGGDGGRNAVGGQRLRYQYNSEIYKRARKDSGNPSKA